MQPLALSSNLTAAHKTSQWVQLQQWMKIIAFSRFSFSCSFPSGIATDDLGESFC